MERIWDQSYGTMVLRQIQADQPRRWEETGATHLRVSLPSEITHLLWMQEQGFQFVDRMLTVTIPLQRKTKDWSQWIRFPILLETNRKEEILALAERNFPFDRRFQVEVGYSNEVAKPILAQWIEAIPAYYVCFHQEKVVGFLALQEEKEANQAQIVLAAVEKRYQATGVALSLYAKAIQVGVERGYRAITGQISCWNTAVLNLYAYLGGVFSNPQDIYLKQRSRTRKEGESE